MYAIAMIGNVLFILIQKLITIEIDAAKVSLISLEPVTCCMGSFILFTDLIKAVKPEIYLKH